VEVNVGPQLRAAWESGDFESLRGLYADGATLDWSLPGERVQARGPERIVEALAARWRGAGELTRWDVSEFASGLTLELERHAHGALARQRQFLQVRNGRITRHQAYAARPHSAAPGDLPDDAALAAVRRLGTIARREPLTHMGQAGNSLERDVLDDGRRVVVKRMTGDDWVARQTHDPGRELAAWESGLLARLPHVVDHAVLDGGRDGAASFLVMRDVSAELLPPARRVTREESRRVLGAAAEMHGSLAGESAPGACSLNDKITLTAPHRFERALRGPDYLPKMLVVGWEVFTSEAPQDVGDAVLALLHNPAPLADALRRAPQTVVHGDLRGANLGLLPDRVVMLDWGLVGEAPAAVDFGWYLFVNGWRIDATREQVIDDFLELDAADALELALLANFCWLAPLIAHELVEASDEKRERAHAELGWWIARTRAALELM
jgi:aminoglycoside phosphotransferase (APT) family kinase protein